MAAIATTVPVKPRRARPITSRLEQPGASEALQSDRLDVLVHLRAFARLDPQDNSSLEALFIDDGIDWVSISGRYSELDAEPTVGDIVAAHRSGTGLGTSITLVGGKLLAGSVSAAASLFYGIDVPIRIGFGRTPNRSQSVLVNDGFTPTMLRSLAVQLLAIDKTSRLLLLALDDKNFDGTYHELSTRFDRFHTELDHLDDQDVAHIGGVETCSTQIVLVRAGGESIENMIERHPAVIASAAGPSALALASYLFGTVRKGSTCREHRALKRSERRADVLAQLLARARGR